MSETRGITAIILAAGKSVRMGDFKPLLPFGEMTVLERSVRLFQTIGIPDIRVVIGYRSSDLIPLIDRLNATRVLNENHEEGMFSSVLAGVQTLGRECRAFFIHPVDIPLVRFKTIRDLLRAHQERKGAILYPVLGKVRGHPPLISSKLAETITKWNGAGGLRRVLAQHEHIAADVSVADEGILLDMDTPEDLRRLHIRCQHLQIPTVRECLVMLSDTFDVENHVRDHCRAVMDIALRLGDALIRFAGIGIDLELLAAAGLLHDSVRRQPDHAAAASRILKELGFDSVAEIVRDHMDITVRDEAEIDEREIVYLADKLVQGDLSVSLETKFGKRLNEYAENPEALAAIQKRLADALKIKRRLETAVGRSLQRILSTTPSKRVKDLVGCSLGFTTTK